MISNSDKGHTNLHLLKMHICKSLTGASDVGRYCTVSKCNTAIYACKYPIQNIYKFVIEVLQ